MGKVFRAVYIVVPLALTIGAILSLVFVFIGGLDSKNQTLNKNYFLKADTSNFTYDPDMGKGMENALLTTQGTNARAPVASDYFIYFSSYCAANTSSSVNATDIWAEFYYCSPSARSFWFNPIDVWQLNNTVIDQDFPKELQDGINSYKKVAGWMYAAYMIAFWVLVIEAVLGLFAICSRIISLIVTMIAGAAALFTFAASLTSTITYAVLAGAINSALKPYRVHASLGSGQLAATWMAVAFALGAMFFWTFSICCCSPHSRHPQREKDGSSGRRPFFAGRGGGDRGRTRGRMGTGLLAERTGGYERVSSPYMGGYDGRARSVSPGPGRMEEGGGYGNGGHHRAHSEGVPMMDMADAGDMGAREKGAYEPYRHS